MSADKRLHNIQGILVYKGPGSFTGLRIGISTANSLTYSLGIPIATSKGDDWLVNGIESLLAGCNEYPATPEYGSEPHITAPKR